MTSFRRHGRALRGVLATFLALGVCLGAAGTATAAQPDCSGRGVPASKISIQLWTFAGYVGFGSDAATQARLEEVLRRLSAMGYRNVEPFSFHGLTAAQFRDLLDEHGLKAPARHVNVGTPEAPVDIAQVLADNKTLGIKFFGSGGTPRNYTTAAQWEAYAAYLDRVGEQARKAGQTLIVHNHNWEFVSFGDRTAYDILLAETSKKDVAFQLDLYWAAFAGVDPAALLRKAGNRVQLLHVKDMAGPELNRRIEIVGEGVLDFPSIFQATKGPAKFYVVEHDPRFNDPSFDPFEAAQKGFTYLSCVSY